MSVLDSVLRPRAASVAILVASAIGLVECHRDDRAKTGLHPRVYNLQARTVKASRTTGQRALESRPLDSLAVTLGNGIDPTLVGTTPGPAKSCLKNKPSQSGLSTLTADPDELRTKAKQFAAQQLGDANTDIHIYWVTSTDAISEAVHSDVAASASGGFGPLHVNLSANQQVSHLFSSTSKSLTFVLVKRFTALPATQVSSDLDDGSVSKEDWQGMSHRDPDQFLHNCGSLYISAVHSGATLYAVITASDISSDDRSALAQELQGSGSYGTFGSVAIEAKRSATTIISNHKDSLDIHTGAEGSQLLVGYFSSTVDSTIADSLKKDGDYSPTNIIKVLTQGYSKLLEDHQLEELLGTTWFEVNSYSGANYDYSVDARAMEKALALRRLQYAGLIATNLANDPTDDRVAYWNSIRKLDNKSPLDQAAIDGLKILPRRVNSAIALCNAVPISDSAAWQPSNRNEALGVSNACIPPQYKNLIETFGTNANPYFGWPVARRGDFSGHWSQKEPDVFDFAHASGEPADPNQQEAGAFYTFDSHLLASWTLSPEVSPNAKQQQIRTEYWKPTTQSLDPTNAASYTIPLARYPGPKNTDGTPVYMTIRWLVNWRDFPRRALWPDVTDWYLKSSSDQLGIYCNWKVATTDLSANLESTALIGGSFATGCFGIPPDWVLLWNAAPTS